MKKKSKKLFVGLMMVFTPLTLAGCNSFMASKNDDLLAISSVSTKTDEAGDIWVTITYSDESKEPLTFKIPKGNDGVDGISIKNITYTPSEDGKTTKITIYYTDDNKKPDTFSISNGVGVESVRTKENDDGSVTLIFKYTDGTESEPLIVPKGDEGDGIAYIDSANEVNEDGEIRITIYLTNGESYDVLIPSGEKGQDGKGIKTIVSSTNENKYVLTITYTDNTSETITFDKPQDGKDGATWLNGDEDPNNSLGKNGDYYFNNKKTSIWFKRDGSWSLVVSINADQTTYKVTFNLNDTNEEPAYMPGNWSFPYEKTLNKGSYFAGTYGEIPFPTRPSYNFLGWCTSTNYDVTKGLFTDLTPVMADLSLYALWEKK